MSYEKQQELEEARRKEERQKAQETIRKNSAGGEAKKIINDTKNLAKNVTPTGFFSLLFKINIFSDWMYGLALFAAMLKDLSDFAFIGSFPLIGTVITFLVSIFIGFMMLLGGIMNGQGRKQYKMIRSYMILAGGTIIEAFLFGLNFIPVETLTVLFVWMMLLSARKKADEERRNFQYSIPNSQ